MAPSAPNTPTLRLRSTSADRPQTEAVRRCKRHYILDKVAKPISGHGSVAEWQRLIETLSYNAFVVATVCSLAWDGVTYLRHQRPLVSKKKKGGPVMNDENCVNIVGPYVRKFREERGWSLKQLADEFARQGVPVSPQTLERIESRQDEVTEIDAMAFAHVFKTDVSKLYPSNPTAPEVLGELRRIQQNARPAKNRRGFVLESMSTSS